MTDEQTAHDARARAGYLFEKVTSGFDWNGHSYLEIRERALTAILAHDAETAAIEREACAKIAENGEFVEAPFESQRVVAEAIANAIRARGSKP